MRSCPDCGTVYSPSATTCTRDGATLEDAPGFRGGQPVDPAAELAERLIAGRFEIEREIGSGGMGIVYRAVQRPLGRPVALKVLRDTVRWNDDTVKRFHQEARAMSHLQHAHTVRVFDFGSTDEGHLYLAMELLEGATLTDALSAKILGVPDGVEIADQILASLEEAHGKGIVHRDLKPDNIFLRSNPGGETHVKVLDFGIAKVIHGDLEIDQLETQAGTVFGTPRYMSPEQAQGIALDGRSDLYTVGVLLYEMTTGSPPFDAEDAVLVMARHIRDMPPSPRARDPYALVPAQLDRVIMRALAKDPADRFPDATAFREALADAMPSILRYERASGVALGVDRAVRRTGRKLWWGLAAAAALVLVGLALYKLRGAPETVSGPRLTSGQATRPASGPVPGAGDNDNDNDDVGERANRNAQPGITTTLNSIPPGAEVWLGDSLLGTTPVSHELEAGTVADVVLRARGYTDTPFQLAAIAPPQDVTLRPRPRSGARSPMTTSMMNSMRTGRSMRPSSGMYERFD